MSNKIKYRLLLLLILSLIGIFIFIIIRSISDEKKETNIEVDVVHEESIYSYGDNEYKVYTISDEDLITYYYKYYVRLLKDDLKQAWDMLTEKNKKSKFNNSFVEFEEYIEKMKTSNFLSSSVDSYKVTGDQTYSIVNTEGYMFNIKTNGIWNLTVELTGTVDK